MGVPAEYFNPNDSGVLTYALDLSENGTFICSDDPLVFGSRFGVHLSIPVDDGASKIFRTEATVAWNRMQSFKSKRNGMGVHFVEPLPEDILLNALACTYRKLIKETEPKKLLEERVEKLESALEETKRLASLGRCVEKILFEISNPILSLSGNLETLKGRMSVHKAMLEEHGETNKKEFTRITKEFNTCCGEIDKILKDYKIISELAHLAADDRETVKSKLTRYHC